MTDDNLDAVREPQGAMYRNAMTPSRLSGLILLLFAMAGIVLWFGQLSDTAAPAFSTTGLLLLGFSLGLLALAILFLRRVRWVRVTTSILLHIACLAFVGWLILTLPETANMTDGTAMVSFGGLCTGLLFVGILGLHSEAMKHDMATGNTRAHASSSHKRRYIAAAIACFLLLLALCAWWIVPLLVAEPTLAVDYQPQIDEAMRPADYDPNRDAAPHYDRLFSQFVPLPEALQTKYKLWPTELSDEERETLEKWGPTNEPALTTLAQAIQCPYWCHSMERDQDGFTTQHVMRSRDFAWAIILFSKLRAGQGDVNGALRLLTDLHKMGLQRIQGVTLADQMAGLASCTITYDAILAILAHCPAEVETLKPMLDTFASRVSQIDVLRFSRVEYLLGCNAIQCLFTDDGAGDGRLIPRKLYESKRNRRSLCTTPIPFLAALRICVTHPSRLETTMLFEAYWAFVQDFARRTPWALYTESSSHERRLQDVFADNYFLRDWLASVGPGIQIAWRDRLSGDAFIAVLAISTYKSQESRLPESLKQVADAGLLRSIPMDPYSGAPLVYRVTGDGFTLYSVGEDFVDDGGWACQFNGEILGDRVFWPVAQPEEGEDEG